MTIEFEEFFLLRWKAPLSTQRVPPAWVFTHGCMIDRVDIVGALDSDDLWQKTGRARSNGPGIAMNEITNASQVSSQVCCFALSSDLS